MSPQQNPKERADVKGKQPSGARAAEQQSSKKGYRKPKSAVGSTRVKDRSRLSERMRKSTRRSLFVRALIPDSMLVLLVSVALAYTASYGFESAPDLRSNVLLIAILNLPLLAAMFWGTWSKRMLGPSIVATVVVSVVIVATFIAISPPGGEMVSNADETSALATIGINDVPENYGIFAMVVVVCAVATFLLSRRTVGLVVLLVLSVVTCGAIQFLYRDWVVEQPGIFASVVVLFGIGMLFVYQCYRQSVYSANRVKKTSFPGAFGFSALVGLACVLVGVGVYYGVVAGLELTTPEIKPFEEHVSPPESENPQDYQNDTDRGDDTSDNTDDSEQEGDESQEEPSGSSNALGFLENTFIADMVKSALDYDNNSLESQDNASLPLVLAITAIIIAVLILLAALAFIVFWRYRREIRLRIIAKRSHRYQVWYLYTFLIGRFARLRMKQPPNLTPMEFALGFERPMVPFTRGTDGADFVEVTEIYEDAVFGAIEPSSEDLERVIRYYRAFFRNARIHTGWPKWIIWKYWRI